MISTLQLGGGNAGTLTSTVRVLIVDDHELVRHGLMELLASQPNLQVCGEASDEVEAIRMAQTERPDLMIVDISLRQGNGIDLIKQINARQPQIKMLVSSMYDERLYAERALRAGARGYVHKQQPAATIIEAIQKVLDGKLFLSESMTERMLRRASGSLENPEQSPVEGLSDRELEIFEMIGQGMPTRRIAAQLHLSPKTVETYRERLKTKLNIDNAAELTQRAVQWVLENA